MTKQTFQIPDGCKAITMEQIGNQLVTTFEVERKFKDGDVVITDVGSLCIFKQYTDINEFESYLNNSLRSNINWRASIFHLATPEEAQRLWDYLAERDKKWNPETKEVEEIKKERQRGEVGDRYFYINEIANISTSMDDGHYIDGEYYKVGNYFRTEEQAERAKQYIQKALDEFWKEELK